MTPFHDILVREHDHRLKLLITSDLLFRLQPRLSCWFFNFLFFLTWYAGNKLPSHCSFELFPLFLGVHVPVPCSIWLGSAKVFSGWTFGLNVLHKECFCSCCPRWSIKQPSLLCANTALVLQIWPLIILSRSPRWRLSIISYFLSCVQTTECSRPI